MTTDIEHSNLESTEEQPLPLNDTQAYSKGAALGMSVVSKKYDRNQKGYLDSTEMTLRQMDTENKGHLDVDKVYDIMKELRAEQKNNMSLKKIIYALSAFSVLLCLANIGTSFVAAVLAKDASVNTHTFDLNVKGTDHRVGVTSKSNVVNWNYPTDSDGRRRLDLGDNITLETALDWWDNVCTGFDMADFNAVDENTAMSRCDSIVTQGFFLGNACPHFGIGLLPHAEGVQKVDDMVVFKYDGFRGYWNYGTVTVSCPATGVGDCTYTGLSCIPTCEACDNSGQKVYWICETGYCDCSPRTCRSELLYECGQTATCMV